MLIRRKESSRNYTNSPWSSDHIASGNTIESISGGLDNNDTAMEIAPMPQDSSPPRQAFRMPSEKSGVPKFARSGKSQA